MKSLARGSILPDAACHARLGHAHTTPHPTRHAGPVRASMLSCAARRGLNSPTQLSQFKSRTARSCKDKTLRAECRRPNAEAGIPIVLSTRVLSAQKLSCVVRFNKVLNEGFWVPLGTNRYRYCMMIPKKFQNLITS